MSEVGVRRQIKLYRPGLGRTESPIKKEICVG